MHPDEMQEDLIDVMDSKACLGTIHYALKRRGYRRKKVYVVIHLVLMPRTSLSSATQVTRIPLQRDEQACAAFSPRIASQYRAEQLVVVDEAGCNRKTVQRDMGWAVVGCRARRRALFAHGHKYV